MLVGWVGPIVRIRKDKDFEKAIKMVEAMAAHLGLGESLLFTTNHLIVVRFVHIDGVGCDGKCWWWR